MSKYWRWRAVWAGMGSNYCGGIVWYLGFGDITEVLTNPRFLLGAREIMERVMSSKPNPKSTPSPERLEEPTFAPDADWMQRIEARLAALWHEFVGRHGHEPSMPPVDVEWKAPTQEELDSVAEALAEASRKEKK